MPLRLVAGEVPDDGLNIGFQNDGVGDLWLAVADTKWGTIPGKAKDQTCWFSYGGKEHYTSKFKWVASTAEVSLIKNDGSGPPASATHMGYQNDGTGKLYGAVAASEWGDIPGKAKDNTCWFSYGGEEHYTEDFQWVNTEDKSRKRRSAGASSHIGATSQYDENSGPEKAFEDDTFWHSGKGSLEEPEMIWIEYENPTIVTKVSFGSREDGENFDNDGPSKFELVGTLDSNCNEQSDWITIASDLSGSYFTWQEKKELEVPLCNLQPFKGYGIRILDVPGRQNENKWITVSDLDFTRDDDSNYMINKGATSQYSHEERADLAFEGALQGKAIWHSGKGSLEEPEMIWVEYENPTVAIEVSFGSREDGPNYHNDGPSKFELVGTHDSNCDENSQWITIASNHSGTPFKNKKAIRKLEVPSHSQQLYKGYGIRILDVPGRSNEEKWVTMSHLSFVTIDAANIVNDVPEEPEKGDTLYNIIVVMGEDKNSGTDKPIYLSIVSEKGKYTKPLKLNKNMKEDGVYLFSKSAQDVGKIHSVIIFPDSQNPQLSHFDVEFFIKQIVIHKKNVPFRYLDTTSIVIPIHQWIACKKWFTQCEGKDVPPNIVDHFSLDLEEERLHYNWGHEWLGLPGHLDTGVGERGSKMEPLLLGQQLNEAKTNVMGEIVVGLKHQQIQKQAIQAKEQDWSSFDDYIKVFESPDGPDSRKTYKNLLKQYGLDRDAVPDWIHNWQEDEEFGRQMLNGLNPRFIQKCDEIPEDFLLCQMDLEGKTLEEEMEAGNIYSIDYTRLSPIVNGKLTRIGDNGEQRYLSAPYCLLHVRSDERLVPIAIQLYPKKDQSEDDADDSDRYHVWTKDDGENEWKLAKMFFKSADLHIHELQSHLSYTHLTMEPFVIALYRNFHASHPVFRLLREVLEFLLPVNVNGRMQLLLRPLPNFQYDPEQPKPSTSPTTPGLLSKILAISPTGTEALMKDAFDRFKWEDLNIIKNIATRKVEDLPGYHYRDDALKHHKAIENFVSKIVRNHYDGDEEIENDHFLQSWIKDVHENGFALESDHGIPSALNTIDELVETLTIIIFQNSCGHSSVNYGQYEFAGFIPNMPGHLNQEMKRGIDEAYIINCLPSGVSAIWQALTAYQLSEQRPDDVYIGMYPDWMFNRTDNKKAILEFKEELKEIGKAIDQRNDEIKMPYMYLHPNRVTSGITN